MIDNLDQPILKTDDPKFSPFIFDYGENPSDPILTRKEAYWYFIGGAK